MRAGLENLNLWSNHSPVASTRLTFSHPTGNANVRQALAAFDDAGLDVDFHTTLALCEGSLMWKLANAAGLKEIKRRTFTSFPRQTLHRYPFGELARQFAGKLGLKKLTRHEQGPFCIDRVFQALDRRVAHSLKSDRHRAVYAYEDGAIQSFKAARDLGISCLYDLPIGYWRAGRAIQSEEGERRPEWACTMPALIDSEAKLERKDRELQLAHRIVVATSFTRQTLSHAPFEIAPVTVIPYGSPVTPDIGAAAAKRDPSKPLRVLFVGGLGQRKGTADLLDAVAMCGAGVSLTLIGQRPARSCEPLDAALRTHRWIPTLPHQEVLREMAHHDVFVFPSLFEGFGLVILEALSQGLPVITTSHTAGPDILTEGVDGHIIPIRSPEAIRDRLEKLRTTPGLLESMSQEARKTAARFTWERYRHKLGEWLRDSLLEPQSRK